MLNLGVEAGFEKEQDEASRFLLDKKWGKNHITTGKKRRLNTEPPT
jgi:hypothetical protein